PLRQGVLLRAPHDRVLRCASEGDRQARRRHPGLLTSVTDNPAERRYELRVDGELAGELAYRRGSGTVDLLHTEVDPGLRNKGRGTLLVRSALDDARTRGERVVPTCPFVAAFVRRNPEYQDLV
ncbi:MAG TPA: GNAT family N-acetyltransferase, partial [Gaiellaceae bacterium]|nr:GNAT family N-acetyltransferase [Gaiellaceae bacterium]